MKKKHVPKMRFIVLTVIPIGIIPDTQTRLSDGCSGLMLFLSQARLPGNIQDRGLFSLRVRVVLLVCPLQLRCSCCSMDTKLGGTFKVDI